MRRNSSNLEALQQQTQILSKKTDVLEVLKNSSPYQLTPREDIFYQNVIKHKLIYQVEIIGTREVLPNSSKRYTLVETYKNTPTLEKLYLNRFSPENIEKRRNELQGFIDYFFDLIKKERLVYPFLQFLKILDNLKDFSLDLIFSQVQSNQSDSQDKAIEYQTESSHEKKILDLIQQIQINSDNLSQNLQIIGETISTSNPIQNTDLIKLIFEGNYSGKKTVKGLLQLCGQLDTYTEGENKTAVVQHINCFKNLQILNNVMECEYNSSYELFLKLFQETSLNIIKTINLEQHILSDKHCKQPALKIIAKYMEGLKRMYNEKEVRVLLQKRKLIPFKPRTIDEIENFMSDKKLILKKVQSSTILHQLDRDSVNRFTQSNHLSFSYLDSEIEEKNFFIPRRQFSNIKEALEDQFIQWKTVYHLKEKQIILQHALPIQNYIRMSVVLPLGIKESYDLIVTQRHQWDTLVEFFFINLLSKYYSRTNVWLFNPSNALLYQKQLLECYTFQTQDTMLKSTSSKKEKYGIESTHDYVCETYRWNSQSRICFYSERKIEFEKKKIFITRKPYEQADSLFDQSDRNKFNNRGKQECLIQIKAMDDDNMTSSQKSQQSLVSPFNVKEKFRVFNFNTSNPLPKLGKFFSGKELVQSSDQLSKSGHSNSSDDLNKLGEITNSAQKDSQKHIQEEEDGVNENSLSDVDKSEDNDFFQQVEISKYQKEDSKTNKLHSGLLSLEESKGTQDQRQVNTNDGQETLPNTLQLQNNSYLEQSSSSQRKKSTQNSKKEILERESENDDSEDFSNFKRQIIHKPQFLSYPEQLDKAGSNSNPEVNESRIKHSLFNTKSYQSPFEQGISYSSQNKDKEEERKQKDYNSLSDTSGCSINFINSAKSQTFKKQSEDIQPNELEDSILIDPESSVQIITKNPPVNNTQQNDSAQQTQISFFFSLLNSETIHFFSKFIIEGDDQTMIHSMLKLQELAKKIRKESSSTSDTKPDPDERKGSDESLEANINFEEDEIQQLKCQQ